MKKAIVILAGVGLAWGNCWASEPAWQEISRGMVNVKTAYFKPDNPKIIYIGTEQGIYKTEDGGDSWRKILSLRGDRHNVNYLAPGVLDRKTVYAATGGGLFVSTNEGQRWTRVFKGRNSFETDCSALLLMPDRIYLGTQCGLFFSKDNGRSWHKTPGKLGNSRIFNFAYLPKDPDCLYLACADGVFQSVNKGKDWKRIFIAHPVEKDSGLGEEDEDRDEEERYSALRYIAINPHNPDELYLATSRGVYKGKDRGRSWELLTEYGLLSRAAQFLLFSDKSGLFAASKSGVFSYGNARWRELSFNLSSHYVNSLALDKNANLYACTEKGLYRMSPDHDGMPGRQDIIAEYSKGEPEIQEVQRQAIKYAEVSPEKISFWRKQAAVKAVLPKLSAGIGRDTGDLWHWEGGSTTKLYDDVLIKGRDTLDWDVTLSWDLSELIWNNDQTSIDARSRLMVQLRDDLLDEVNKLYFERIRVRMEMDSLQIEDRKKRFEKELRLRELTAALDALTGGYFSNQIQRDYI
ncbi:MAG: hypothetical protein WC576_00020 [Candidatus Omnitrophota bacterium]|jgi:photosystem II stability/assembly factor-like uncharacterized protein